MVKTEAPAPSPHRPLNPNSTTDNTPHIEQALAHTQRLAGIGLLTASVAHEMNTPLSIIAATCSNLQHEVEENNLSMEQLLRYITMIEQNAWRAARIVEVLRNYAYDEETETAVTDLNIIIEDALALVQQQFYGEYNLDIWLDLAPNLGSIVCDHNRLMQVVVNLLLNARDAMGNDGGIIQIKSWALPRQAATDGTASESDELYAFSVTDTGRGITADALPHIFEPFYTTKPRSQGAGLGLFIAQRIVQQHHGRIEVETNPHAGCTFTVTLPRK